MKDLTQLLNDRADAKLNKLCEERLGDLFDMCGGHSQNKDYNLDNINKIQQYLANLSGQFKSNPERIPWHGTVFELARLTMEAMLKNQFREREAKEFMEQVERIKEITSYE